MLRSKATYRCTAKTILLPETCNEQGRIGLRPPAGTVRSLAA